MATKKEKEDPERKMSSFKRASLRRKSSMMEEVKKKGVPGTLYKPKESKPYKKSLTAAEIRAQENAEALRKLSMLYRWFAAKEQNLWRRINAGYTIFRNPINSLYFDSFKWLPKLMEPTLRDFMHMRDVFSEFTKALARANLAWPKPSRPPLVFIPAKEKARLKAERMAERAAQKLKAMIKMGMVPSDTKLPSEKGIKNVKGAKVAK